MTQPTYPLDLPRNVKQFLAHFPNTVFTYIPDHGEKPVITGELLDLNKAELGYGTFFSVNGFSNARRVTDNLTNVNAFFVDIDFPNTLDQDKEKIQKFKQELQMELFNGELPAPTALVETKRGFHVYWILQTPIFIKDLNEEQVKMVIERHKQIEEAIIKKFEGDPGAKDIARVLRVPGTIHQKNPQDMFLVNLTFYNTDNLYTFQEIRDSFLTSGEQPDRWAVVASENSIDEKVKEKILEEYPKLQRRSYKSLLDRTAQVPQGFRNKSLLIIATACRESGWSVQQTLDHFGDNFYGLGLREIRRTIQSAFEHTYEFGYNNEVMEAVVDQEERQKLSQVTSKILSDGNKKTKNANNEEQKTMYLSYEHIIATRYPYLKYKMKGDFYDYQDGVYIPLQVQEVQSIILREMLNDGLLNYRKLSAVNDKIACFKSLEHRVFTEADENKNKNIINMKNGLLNISTLTLTPHTPQYLSTIQIPIEYDEKATAPQWSTFVSQIMCEDVEQIKLLAQIAGYSLTPDTNFAKAFIFYGTGANGKSLFNRILTQLVGLNHVSAVNLTNLNKQFGLSGIIGKRLNLIDEISGNYFESNIIKTIISGERVSADIKYRPEPIEFIPTAKLIFSVNELPKINDTTMGLYRRFTIVPFDRSFVSNPDIHLESKLMKELPGILNWALRGLVHLRQTGYFNETQKNFDIMTSFKVENSPLYEYLSMEYKPVDKDSHTKYPVPLNEIYRGYKQYCFDMGYRPKALSNFSKEFTTMRIDGYEITITVNDGIRMVLGIKARRNPYGDTIV